PEDPATAPERATDDTTTAPAGTATGKAAKPSAESTPAEAEKTTTEKADDDTTAPVEGEVVEAAEETGKEQPAEALAEEDGAGPPGAELEMLRKQLDEAQVDIKRVAAEYKNYRDRIKRDQAAAAEVAVASVLSALLPVLDDLDRARDHGDLTGPFGSVAE